MTRTTDQRDLSADDVAALPPSMLRDVLMAAFDIEQLAVRTGLPEGVAALTQYLWIPHREPRVSSAQMLLPDATARPIHLTLDAAAAQLETDIDRWDEVAHPQAGGATLLGMGLIHETWVLPDDDATSGTDLLDGRDPGDVPGALTVMQIKGVTADGAGFTLFRRPGQQPLARVELVPDSDVHFAVHSDVDHDGTDRRHDRLQQAIKRNVDVFRAVYAHSAGDNPHHQPYTPSTYSPPPHDDTSANTPGRDTLDLDHRGLSIDDVERLLPSTLQDLVLHAIHVESQQPQPDCTNPSCVVVQHNTHRADNGLCHTEIVVLGDLGIPANLTSLAQEIRNSPHIRAKVSDSEHDHRYLGTSIMTDSVPFIDSIPSLSRSVDHFRPGTTRMIIGTCYDGSFFLIDLDHAHSPEISVFQDAATAAVALGDRATHVLQTINDVFAGSTSDTPPATARRPEQAPKQPTGHADLSTLPPPLPTTAQNYTLLRAPRHPNDPREGILYSAVPADDPLAARLCLCGEPLANGKPVQTYAVAPFDLPAMRAAMAGSVHESVFFLGHHQCVLKLGSGTLANALTAVFGTWGTPA